MPGGKPAGVRCVQLDDGGLCRLFGLPERPAVCVGFRAGLETCGSNAKEAYALLAELERLAAPETELWREPGGPGLAGR